MILAVYILRYGPNIYEQGRKGMHVLYYIVSSISVLRWTVSIDVLSHIDKMLVKQYT